MSTNIPDYQQRVIDEAEELQGRIDKLAEFIDANPAFMQLPQDERSWLTLQMFHMFGYHGALTARIKTFTTPRPLAVPPEASPPA